MCMKFISTTGIITVIGIVLFCYIFFGLGAKPINQDNATISIPNADTAFGGIFSSFNISNTLPYGKYKKLEEKFNRRMEYRNTLNEGKFISSLFFGNTGFSAESMKSMDSTWYTEDKQEKQNMDLLDSLFINLNTEKDFKKKFNLKKYYDSIKNEIENKSKVNYITDIIYSGKGVFYFSLKGYNLDFNNKFFITNEKYNLAFVKLDKGTFSKDSQSIKIGHYEEKQIKVRYNQSNNSINIPISAKLYSILKTALMIIISLLSGLALYFFIGLPFQILLNISRSEVFILNNLRYINQICSALIIATLFAILLPLILHLIFMNRIPAEIYRDSILSILKNYFGLILSAIVLIIVRKAFKKGYDLQNEQDLTV
jgi:Protein of unknown function (DUF2975)